MSGINSVTVVGRLGQDPELRQTQGGQAVATISVATSEQWKDKNGEKQEKTEWHRIIVWGPQAENAAKYLKKGSLAGFQGRLETRSWEDKETKVKRYTTEIIASSVQFLGSASDNAGSRAPHPGEDSAAPQQSFSQAGGGMGSADLNDIPF
jgi:single-strand DNA-binding protein